MSLSSAEIAARVQSVAATDNKSKNRATIMIGYVSASSLTRLLDRLSAPGSPLRRVPVEYEVGPHGYPQKTSPESGDQNKKAEQYRIDRMRPFAILSGFRAEYTLKENMKRSGQLLRYLNNLMAKPGAYKLIGHWVAPTKEGENMPYLDAYQLGKMKRPVVEESYLVIKPEAMPYDDFERTIVELGRWFGQEAVLLHDGDTVSLFFPEEGKRESIGTGLLAPLIPKAYSRMRNQPQLPFVFAGLLCPHNWMSVVAFGATGLIYVGEANPKLDSTYTAMLGPYAYDAAQPPRLGEYR